MRKPISVSATECGLIVICDDGSIWELFKNKWEMIKDIPQDKREVKETNEEHYLKLTKKDMLELIEHIKLGGQLNYKIAEFIKDK